MHFEVPVYSVPTGPVIPPPPHGTLLGICHRHCQTATCIDNDFDRKSLGKKLLFPLCCIGTIEFETWCFWIRNVLLTGEEALMGTVGNKGFPACKTGTLQKMSNKKFLLWFYILGKCSFFTFRNDFGSFVGCCLSHLYSRQIFMWIVFLL